MKKLNHKRFNKLIILLVWIYSISAILYGILGFMRWEDVALRSRMNEQECLKNYIGSDLASICNNYTRSFVTFEHMIWFGLISGIAVLVVFYGGKLIYKYLFTNELVSVTETT